MYIYLSIYIYCLCCYFKQKTDGREIFLNPFTVCSSCKWKFVICPFVSEETNGSYCLTLLKPAWRNCLRISRLVAIGLQKPYVQLESCANLVMYDVF